MNIGTETKVQAYLDRLRRELADLPASEIDEIMQDLEPQLAAMAEELGTELFDAVLADRLGTPTEYASELRAAMDLPAAGPAHPPRWLPRAALWVLVGTTVFACCGGYFAWGMGSNDFQYALPFLGLALVLSWFLVGRRRSVANEIEQLPEVREAIGVVTSSEQGRQLVAYLKSLQPGWFLARAGLTAAATLCVFRSFYWSGSLHTIFAFAGAVLTLVAGYRAVSDRRWLWLSVPLTGWAVGVMIRLGAELVEYLA